MRTRTSSEVAAACVISAGGFSGTGGWPEREATPEAIHETATTVTARAMKRGFLKKFRIFMGRVCFL